MKKILLLSCFLCLITINGFTQNKTIDSLKLALKNAKHDTTRCNILNAIIQAESNNDISLNYTQQLIKLADKNINSTPSLKKFYLKQLSSAYNDMGYIISNYGDIAQALSYYLKSVQISEEIGEKDGIAASLNNIADLYHSQGDIQVALKYYARSLKISEEIGYTIVTASSLNNIAQIYQLQDDINKALEYYFKVLRIDLKTGNKNGVGFSLNNIGMIYHSQGDFKKAYEYIIKSLKIFEETGEKQGLAICLSNLALLHEQKNEDSLALKYLNESVNVFEKINNKQGVANSLNNIGKIYLHKKKYTKSIIYAEKSIHLGYELGFPDVIRNASKLLYEANKAIGNEEKALEYHEQYIQMRDSITNQENKKESIKSQFKYEYEKKAAADSIKVAEEKKVVAVQLKQEKTQRFALYGGLALVVLFAGFMFNRFRITQKQKNIIELKEKETQQQNEIITIQKHLVEEKHKEITDSINYAERIQRSFLATKELLDENLNRGVSHAELDSASHETLKQVQGDESSYFVFFKPKDVVSGDFYWSAKLNNGNFALATADSTGHGVPGAIMSLLNVTSLEKAIEHYTNPADILNHTRQTIIERLKKDGSEEGGKDGMDCSLLVFDYTNKQLHIAAANNPVWIIRSVSSSVTLSGVEGKVENKYELIEIKPDKMPVGKSERQHESFTLHTVGLQKGDTIYTLTDGFPDQFGGPNGKKFMSKKLKELLISNVALPIAQQKELLDTTFKNWVGDLEQVDDVCIIGIKI